MVGRVLLFALISKTLGDLAGLIHSSLTALRFHLLRHVSYRVRPGDIFIVSYPKAGTTAIQMMLYQLLRDGDMRIGHIDSVVPWFEAAVMKGPQFMDQLSSPRAFKTHMTLPAIPRRGRCIYLIRNPKDSCISYYHHLTSLNGASFSLPQFVDLFVGGKIDWGSWFQHLLVSWPLAHRDNVLLVNYDDISQHPAEVVDAVSRFCGVTLTPAKRRDVIARCSLEFMKAHSEKFDPRFAGIRDDRTRFIRKGLSGDWANELTPEAARRIDRHLDATLLGLRHAKSDLPLFLLPSAPGTIAGTVSILIAPDAPITVLAPSESDTRYTLIVPFAKELGVREGDVVRLRLGFADSAAITDVVSIDKAKVVHVTTTKGVYFAFDGCADIDHLDLLSRFISGGDPGIARSPNEFVNQT